MPNRTDLIEAKKSLYLELLKLDQEKLSDDDMFLMIDLSSDKEIQDMLETKKEE